MNSVTHSLAWEDILKRLAGVSDADISARFGGHSFTRRWREGITRPHPQYWPVVDAWLKERGL